MLFASEDAPRRPGYIYEGAPGGGLIGYLDTSKPTINVNHIDGPVLWMRNGELHWLTLWERLLLWIGKTDAEKLERKHKYRPYVQP